MRVDMKKLAMVLCTCLCCAQASCSSYRVAEFPFVSAEGVDAAQLQSWRLQTDDAPISYTYDMPDTEENEDRMVSFTDMVEPGDLQAAINLATAAQGENCIGLKDVTIDYRWMRIPLLGDEYRYRITGTPVRKK